MDVDLDLLYMQMITSAGEAKSCYMEALQETRDRHYDRAAELLKEGDRAFVEGRLSHKQLVDKEVAGDKVVMTLMLTHVEDQMMSAEILRTMAEELIDLYKEFHKLG